MIKTFIYQFPKNFVFIVENKFFTQIDWGDGSVQTITDPTTHSYHKYATTSIYTVTFTSSYQLQYKWFTSSLLTNGYGYMINCPNDVRNVSETVKLNYSFSEQGNSSDRIKKIKDQTIYSNLKLRNQLLTTNLPKKYGNYDDRFNTIYGYLYCNFNSVYVFQ
jgi:hypothetical protein